LKEREVNENNQVIFENRIGRKKERRKGDVDGRKY
jgi:hypothetical protein